MNCNSITLPLPPRSTSKQTSIWFHTHIDPNSKCLQLHSTCDTIFIGNAFRFLTKQLPNHSFVNNDAATYIAEHVNSFYIFTTTSPDSDSQRCDNHYGYWKNNGMKVLQYGGATIKRSYWYDVRNPKFWKQ
jgi:hypothetical protein